jgi:sugar lactone lactonase YvrE
VTGTQLTWEIAVASGAELAERPVWDASTNCLIWVDIKAGHLHQLRVSQSGADAGDTIIATAGVPVGAAAPRADGGYVLAAGDGFRLVTADGATAGPPVVPAGMPANVRFNDGACDPAGRFWAGTAATDGQAGTGSLYRLDPDGSVTEILDGVTESNGLESQSRVRAFSFDMATGKLGRERDLIQFAPGDGIADGLVADAEGCLWIAMWDGGCVRHHSADGELLARYPVPVSRPTCPGFGGPNLDELYLTTAWEGLTGERRDTEPLAGHLLRARPGARGQALVCYAG